MQIILIVLYTRAFQFVADMRAACNVPFNVDFCISLYVLFREKNIAGLMFLSKDCNLLHAALKESNVKGTM